MTKDSVSLRDIYNAVNSLEDKLSKKMDKFDERLNILEAFRDRALGIMTVFTLFFSALASYVWKKVFNN